MMRAFLIFEFLAPLSLGFQAGYLLVRLRLRDRAWRFGAGFILLLAVLGPQVWTDQNAYCRVLLPLTFAFNLVVHQRERGTARYIGFWLAGHLGLGWSLAHLLMG